MKQEYLILTDNVSSLGTAKITKNENKFEAEISLMPETIYNRNEVFKGYGVICQSGETKYLGVLDGTHGKFDYCGETLPAGIVITRKNITTGEEIYFCHGACDGNLTLVYNIFNNKGKPDAPLKEQKESKSNYKEEINDVEIKDGYKKQYVSTARTKLAKLLKEYKTEKVNGYYLKISSPLLEFILKEEEVKNLIVTYGFYILGIKESPDEKEFVVVLPTPYGSLNPFKNCEEYGIHIKGDVEEDISYWCIIAGTDMSGEYFKKPQ